MNVRTLKVGAAALVGLVLAACGGNGGGGAGGGETAAPESPTVLETTTTDLGTFLVDGDGYTLYLFTTDSPGTSSCEGPCLDMWPPLTGEVEAGDGVDAALIGTLERSDGSQQVSYGDWPLYRYAPDTSPGDVRGQGANGLWWVVGPEATAITATAGTTDTTPLPGY